MKTKEFIKRVKSLGFKVGIAYKGNDEIGAIIISDYEESEFVRIWPRRYAISTIFDGFNSCINSEELYKLCFEYASTPVEDREEEKKFYAKHKYLVGTEYRDANYLNFGKYDCDKLWLGFKSKRLNVQTQFTLKEIEEIKEEFDIDLKDFELVEVEDVD